MKAMGNLAMLITQPSRSRSLSHISFSSMGKCLLHAWYINFRSCNIFILLSPKEFYNFDFSESSDIEGATIFGENRQGNHV